MRNLAIRNSVMGGSTLPYDAEVEYIESTGTQFINTGIIPNSDTTAVLVAASQYFVTPKAGSEFEMFGVKKTGSSLEDFVVRHLGASMTAQYGTFSCAWKVAWGNGMRVFAQSADEYMTISLGGEIVGGNLSGTLRVNDSVLRWGNGSWQAHESCYLFRVRNRTNGGLPFKCRSFVIYDGTTKVRDYIPVRVGSVGHLYDRVSEQLFGNAGTDAFIVGSDKQTITANLGVLAPIKEQEA